MVYVGPRVSEDLGGRAGSLGIHLSISPLSFFGPQPSIFLWREGFETLKKFPRQVSPPFGVKFEGLCFQFFETHAAILHQNGYAETAVFRLRLACGFA